MSTFDKATVAACEAFKAHFPPEAYEGYATQRKGKCMIPPVPVRGELVPPPYLVEYRRHLIESGLVSRENPPWQWKK